MLALLVCCLATVHSTPAGEFTHTRWSGTEVVAPDFVVKGKVVDDSGIALPGATIAVKGTTNGTVTDGNGTFALRLPDAMASSAVLVVTYTGYITREIAVNGKNELSIVLSANTLQLGDLVVIGYGSQSKKDLTGSVGQVNVQSVTKLPTNDLTKAIQGQVAGVSVHGGGEPGATPRSRFAA